jgi:hypothetical protein
MLPLLPLLPALVSPNWIHLRNCKNAFFLFHVFIIPPLHSYGEPAAQIVRDVWQGRNGLFHRMLAQEGKIVMCVDNRGTPAPRGRSWRKSIYRQIGLLASADQVSLLRTSFDRIRRGLKTDGSEIVRGFRKGRFC